jgi:hypothetical protein
MVSNKTTFSIHGRLPTLAARGEELLTVLHALWQPSATPRFYGTPPGVLKAYADNLMRIGVAGGVRDREGRTLLHHALFAEDRTRFDRILTLPNLDVNTREASTGLTVLVRAAMDYNDKTPYVESFMSNKSVNPGIQGFHGQNALASAEMRDRTVMADLIRRRLRALGTDSQPGMAKVIPLVPRTARRSYG